MSRDFFINGESMVSVKGNIGTLMPSITQLGLAEGPIKLRPSFRHRDIAVDAWGNQVPPEVQWMLSEVSVVMRLVHFDRTILAACVAEAMGGVAAEGMIARAGTRLGGNNARFAAGWHFISLNILSPIAVSPWRFYNAYLAENPFEFPLGTEKSVVDLNWRVIPYTTDPWQGGLGAQNQILWDHTSDT